MSAWRILLLSASYSAATASQCIRSKCSNVSRRVSSITDSSAFSRSFRRKPAMSVSLDGIQKSFIINYIQSHLLKNLLRFVILGK